MLGLHGPADPARWAWDAGGIATVKAAKVTAVKLLTGDGIDASLVNALRREGVILFLARLFFPVNGGMVSPADFVHSVRNSALSLYQAGVTLFEVGNEQNLRIEGYGSQWKTPEEWASWYNEVTALLRPEMPEARFGFPGLSPGASIPDVRPIGSDDFFYRAFPLVRDCQWAGLHCYWQDGYDGAMREAMIAGEFAEDAGLPVYVTEFSNPAPNYDKAQKAREYLRFMDYLDGIEAAFSFVESASYGFAHETWRWSAIPGIIGARVV